MPLPVAIQLYTVREEASADLAGTLSALADMGYAGVEFAGLYGLEPEAILPLLHKNQLTAVSAHVPLDEMIEKPQEVIRDYKLLGCKYLAMPYLTPDRRPGSPGFQRTIHDIETFGQRCTAAGMTLLYHNHDFEFEKINGEYALDMIYRTISPQFLQTEIDTCWVHVAGEDPVAYIMKYTGRAPLVHLKDFVMPGKSKPSKLYELIGIEEQAKQPDVPEFGFMPVGSGVQDMPAILDASIKAEAAWVVVEQDRPAAGDSALDSARKSRDYLRNLGW